VSREREIVGGNGGVRAVRSTGTSVVVATAALALLSAGAVASIGLVGIHQLAPAHLERTSTGRAAALHAPATVVVTPRDVAQSPGSQDVSRPRESKPRAATVAVIVPTSTRTRIRPRTNVHRPVANAPTVHVPKPAVTVSPVPVPAVTVSPVPVPAVTVTVVPVAVQTPTPPSLPAPMTQPRGQRRASHEHQGSCGKPAGGHRHEVDRARGNGRDAAVDRVVRPRTRHRSDFVMSRSRR
jgi:hypothetical protein